MHIGRIGVFLGSLGLLSAGEERRAVEEIEALGYGAIWFAEGTHTRESFTHAATLLSWTRRIVIATGISNVYARDPVAMANGARTLADAYPGRFILGLGTSHTTLLASRGHSKPARPVTALRSYLDAMEDAGYHPPEPAQPAPIVLAALGPRMLGLARERAIGAHPYLTTPTHTKVARDILGLACMLAPVQPILLEWHPEIARAVAREYLSFSLGLPNYRASLLRLGFDDEDFQADGSERLVDALVAWGTRSQIKARVAEHIEHGADHVCVQALGRSPLVTLRTMANALMEL